MDILPFNRIPPFYKAAQGQPEEPNGVHVIVETPRGTRNKFAWNEDFGVLELSRTLKSGMSWPCDFGFIPQTLAGDGDPLDVAVLIEDATFPGCLVKARILGVIGFVKNGQQNDRLLACPVSKKGAGSRWDDIHDLKELQPRLVRELEAFLSDYNTFEGNKIELTGWGDADAAMEEVKKAVKRFKAENA